VGDFLGFSDEPRHFFERINIMGQHPYNLEFRKAKATMRLNRPD